jgi:hypothetical protein
MNRPAQAKAAPVSRPAQPEERRDITCSDCGGRGCRECDQRGAITAREWLRRAPRLVR